MLGPIAKHCGLRGGQERDSLVRLRLHTPPVGIGRINTEGELLYFIKQNVEVPDNLQALLAGGFLKLVTAADMKMAVGSQSLTWTASTDSNTPTITHGLGTTPSYVFATAKSAPAFAGIPALNPSVYTATTFDLNGRTPGAVSQTLTVHWLAIA